MAEYHTGEFPLCNARHKDLQKYMFFTTKLTNNGTLYRELMGLCFSRKVYSGEEEPSLKLFIFILEDIATRKVEVLTYYQFLENAKISNLL